MGKIERPSDELTAKTTCPYCANVETPCEESYSYDAFGARLGKLCCGECGKKYHFEKRRGGFICYCGDMCHDFTEVSVHEGFHSKSCKRGSCAFESVHFSPVKGEQK